MPPADNLGPKDALDETIQSMLSKSYAEREVARRLVFYDPARVFKEDTLRGFSIVNEISKYFHVPITSVRIVGSAQFGYSYFSRRDFTARVSDLDIAIVSSELFQKYSEISYWLTERYTNLVKFPPPKKEGLDVPAQFREYLSTGYFRPDYMPYCEPREKWFSFFNQISNKHADLFKNINGGVFLSEALLEMRNTNLVKEFQRAAR
jgi:hypothetical protein